MIAVTYWYTLTIKIFMGLFGRLFGNKASGNKPDNFSHKTAWDFYFRNVDDNIGSFYVDLGLSKIAPVNDKPNIVRISLKMNHPKEDGLSSREEFDKLSEIEDRLREFIAKSHNSIYAGRLTHNNRRAFYFYLGDTTSCDKTVSKAMAAFSSYTYDLNMKEDKEWKVYLEYMHPDPREFQSIQNRRVISDLKSKGDPLIKERQVDHWIYFKTQAGREMFLDKIKDDRFQVIYRDFKADSSEFPYSLQIARVDKVDFNSVDDYALPLWQLAGECNGEYDGWETSVEKD
jgi:uncharacterized protein (TIGR01619 family)